MRATKTYLDGKWMLPEEADKLRAERVDRSKRAEFGFPMIMRDIEPYKSMIDGSMITSRSAHREHLARHDCVELGNDMIVPPAPSVIDRKEIIADIKTAIEQVEAGYIPPEGPAFDETGAAIEEPELEPIVATEAMENSTYVRSDVTEAKPKLIIP